MPGTNTLEYYKNPQITHKKFSFTFGPGVNVIKLFTAVIYKFSEKARLFVSCKPFKDSIVFVGEAGVYNSETAFKCSTLRLASGLAHKRITRLSID